MKLVADGIRSGDASQSADNNNKKSSRSESENRSTTPQK